MPIETHMSAVPTMPTDSSENTTQSNKNTLRSNFGIIFATNNLTFTAVFYKKTEFFLKNRLTEKNYQKKF